MITPTQQGIDANTTDMAALITSPEYNPFTVHQIDVKRIVPNKDNPRKDHKEDELLELTESIKQFGVLSAILVRPIENGMFEIIFGERRYYASELANLPTIPAFVRDISDKTSLMIALTENLQRKDIKPLELAAALKRCLEENISDRDGLALELGVSKSFVESRLKLNDLIQQIKEMLDKEEITVTTALVLAKFDQKIQEKCFTDHLKNDNYDSWKSVKAKDLTKRIIRTYLSSLSEYHFDKTECSTCQHNTLNQVLFADEGDCANCQNRTCMEKKNTEYLLEQMTSLAKADPRTDLYSYNRCTNNKAAEKLKKDGYKVEGSWGIYNTVQAPTLSENPAPDSNQYEDFDEYLVDKQKYDTEVATFEQRRKEFDDRITDGTIRKMAMMGERKVEVFYKKAEEQPDVVVDPLKKLREEDKADHNTAARKILKEVQELISEKKPHFNDLSESDWAMLFFVLLDKLDSDWYGELKRPGLSKDGGLTDEIRWEIAQKMTPRRKSVVVKGVLLDYFNDLRSFSVLTTEDQELKLLCKFAKDNYGDKAELIVAQCLEEYQKKHEKTQAKIDAIEKAKKEQQSFASAALPESTNEVVNAEYVDVTDEVSEAVEPDAVMEVETVEVTSGSMLPVPFTGESVQAAVAELPPLDEILRLGSHATLVEIADNIYLEVESRGFLLEEHVAEGETVEVEQMPADPGENDGDLYPIEQEEPEGMDLAGEQQADESADETKPQILTPAAGKRSKKARKSQTKQAA